MLPTLVIGLREGLEAALIVGIVAAFLRASGRLDLLKWAWAGVVAAVVLCLAAGIGLTVASGNLPHRQQEGLETVIALVAVAMVTYMVVWMRRHSRHMKSELEGAVLSALDSGSGWALVVMAFLAVFREGFETAVFLVAAFNESDDPRTAATGALIGILVACGIGYGIYRGGLRINLAWFFTATGVVLVFVAAGLVASALHTAHEANWINFGQQRAVDLTWLVAPGSIRSSLLTGLLGLQPRPTVIEVVGWLVYLVPVLTFVLWPAGKPFPLRAAAYGAASVAVASAVAALIVGATTPDRPDTTASVELATAVGPLVVEFDGGPSGSASARLSGAALDGDPLDLALTKSGSDDHAGVEAIVYESEPVDLAIDGGTRTMTLAEIAGLNGGRLPLGVNADTDPGDIEVTTSTRRTLTLWTDTATGAVIDARVSSIDRTTAVLSAGSLPLGGGAEEHVISATADAVAARVAVAATTVAAIDRAEAHAARERALWTVAAVAALTALGLSLFRRRRVRVAQPTIDCVSAPQPVAEPAEHASHRLAAASGRTSPRPP